MGEISKKLYGCKRTRDSIQLYTQTQIKIKEWFIVRKDIDENEHEIIQLYTQTQIKVKEQFIVRKDLDESEHEKLSNITFKCKIK